MKILLLGKNGQVGWELQRSLTPLGQVISLDRNSTDHCGDFLNPEGLSQTVLAIQPDVIVNAAAYTAVDKAESDARNAHTINAQSPDFIARSAMQIGACVIHFSTDYVFDGSGSKAWSETDTPAPLGVYGASKLAGEQAIAASGARHLIFRTSWVYASRGGNFAKTMLRLAQEHETLSVINDQIGSPTGADLLADVTAHALIKLVNNSEFSGLYHLAAGGETSWYKYAQHVFDRATLKGLVLKLDSAHYNAIPTSDYPTAALRPLNSRLDCTKLKSSFNIHLPHWQQGINRMLDEIL